MDKTRCPLCGARLTAAALLDAGDSLDDAAPGVVAGRCPHCQGRLELRPAGGRVEVGYLARHAGTTRFDVVLCLSLEGLEASPASDGALEVRAGSRTWRFMPGD